MPFTKNDKALVPDWTQIEANTPYLNQRNGRYEMPYQSEFVSTGGDELQDRLRIATRKGIQTLVRYYNRGIQDQTDLERLVEDSLKHVKYWIDPRPTCSFMRVLLSIDYDELVKLSRYPDPPSDGKRYIASFNVKEMKSVYKNLSSWLRTYGTLNQHTKFSIYVNNTKINLIKEADYFEKLIEFLGGLTTEEDSILTLLFNEKLNLLDVKNTEEEIMRGEWRKIVDKRFYNVVTVSFLINYPKVVAYGEKGETPSLNKFLNTFIIGNIILKDDKQYIEDRAYNPIEEAKNRVNDFYDDRKEKVLNEMKRLNEIKSPIVVDLNCGKIPINQAVSEVGNIIYKTYKKKNIEDDVLNNSIITAKYFGSEIDLGDFVGDKAINDLLGFDNGMQGPSNIKEFYKEVLNQIDVRTLTNKLMQCLFIGGDIQTVCVEFHNPLIFKLPDNLKIPSIFDFLSRLAFKLLLALVTEILKWLMSLIINELNKCIRNREQGVAAFENERSISDYFGPNIPVVTDYLSDSISDLLEDDSLADFVSTETSHNFLRDVIDLLTIVEFCQLCNGQASDDVLDLIRCLVETKYTEFMSALDTNHKIESVFSTLGSVINADFCDSIIDSFAGDESVCQPDEANEALRRLLENKGDKITPEQIEEQIDLARKIKQEQAEIYLGLLKNKGDLTETLLAGDTPEDFVKKLLPCAEDNEPMAHMVRLFLNNTIEPLRDSLSQNIADNDFFSVVSVLDSIEDETFVRVASLFKNLSRIRVEGEKIKAGGVILSFEDNPEEAEAIIKATTSSAALNIIRNTGSTTPDITGNIHKDIFSKHFMDMLVEKGVDVQGLDRRGFRNSISDTYLSMFRELLVIYSEDLGQSYVSTKKKELIESLEELFDEEKIEFFENMWRASQEDLIKGVSTTFFAEECKSRDFRDLQKVIFEMCLYLYIRVHIFEFFFKSIYSITEYNSVDWNKGAWKNLIEKEIRKDGVINESQKFIEQLENKRDLKFDDFISEQFSEISNSLKNTDDINSLFKKIRNENSNTASKIFINNIRYMDVYSSSNIPRFSAISLINNNEESRNLRFNLNSRIQWTGTDLNTGKFFIERYIRIQDKPTSPLASRSTELRGVVNLDRWQTYINQISDGSNYKDKFRKWSYGIRLNILWPRFLTSLAGGELVPSNLGSIRNLPGMQEVSDLEKIFFINEFGNKFFVLPLLEIEEEIPDGPLDMTLQFPEQRLLQRLVEGIQQSNKMDIMFPIDDMISIMSLRDYHYFNKNHFNKQRIFKDTLKILKFVIQGIINLEEFTYENKELQTNSRRGRQR